MEHSASAKKLEDAADAKVARHALAEMKRKKQKPKSWEQVKAELKIRKSG